MQYDETAVMMARDMLLIALKIAAPILAAGVIVGLVVSIVQAVTSIQDQTLTFVPKIVVMILAAAVLLPWIVAKLVDYASDLLWLVSSQ
ncbi:MAG: flagellar biosynthetic protein FliQ [Phycisphaeraceae bacterium]|nr:flagellar biosynthetic protein FliQ [Phycisphaeraceae bacterium]